ncbi:hypothetical protein FF2_020976 [Malus domestica]
MVLSKGVLKPLLAFTTPSLDESLDKFSRGTCTPQNCYYQSVPSASAYYSEERNQPFEPAELPLKSNLAAGERGRGRGIRSCISAAMDQRLRDTVSFDSEESLFGILTHHHTFEWLGSTGLERRAEEKGVVFGDFAGVAA